MHIDPNCDDPRSSKFKNEIAESSTATISPARMFLVATTCLPTSFLYAKFKLIEKSGKTLLAHGIFGGSIDVFTVLRSSSEIKIDPAL